MKRLVTIAAYLMALQANAQTTLSVSVSNTLEAERNDQPVVLQLKDYGRVQTALVRDADGRETPCQLDDLDQDGLMDELCFLSNLKAKQTLVYKVTLSAEGEPRSYPARVYTEMLIRNSKVKEKNRHNNYIESITARGDCADPYTLLHHHGVSFESELNGIRIYFDKRQTLDLYGKFSKRLELQETQFYTSAEQKAKGYGDDVLWVGQTYGLGAFRGWDGTKSTMIDPVKSRTQRIVSYGPLRTIVEVEDRGWKADSAKPAVSMTLRYTQYAGHRDTDIDVLFDRDVTGYRFSTGIINVKDSREMSDHRGLRACWGTDYPSTDTLNWKPETVGLAILLRPENVVDELPADPTLRQGGDYGFVVCPRGQRMRYKVAYCSANETFGFHSAGEWFAWLQQWRRETEVPVVVRVR